MRSGTRTSGTARSREWHRRWRLARWKRALPPMRPLRFDRDASARCATGGSSQRQSPFDAPSVRAGYTEHGESARELAVIGTTRGQHEKELNSVARAQCRRAANAQVAAGIRHRSEEAIAIGAECARNVAEVDR